MCENHIIAFGMNGMEIALTIAAFAGIIGLAVLMIMYLNGHIAPMPKSKLTREQISELHSHIIRKDK